MPALRVFFGGPEVLELVERIDPRGLPYFWIGGPPPSGPSVPGTDFPAVGNRRISVTPIHLDLTGRRLLRRLHTWTWALPDRSVPRATAAEPPGPGEPTEADRERALDEERRRERR